MHSKPITGKRLNVEYLKGVMQMRYFFIVCVLVLLTACASLSVVPQRLGQLSVGMTKADVMKTMEVTPSEFRSHLNTEYLIYETHTGDYFVQLIDGKFNAYVKKGDFDYIIPQRLGQLSVGMTESDVLKIMGVPPSQFKAHLNTKYYIYESNHVDHFVRFVDGKVNAYGKQGDFDSTKDPAFNLNIKSDK